MGEGLRGVADCPAWALSFLGSGVEFGGAAGGGGGPGSHLQEFPLRSFAFSLSLSPVSLAKQGLTPASHQWSLGGGRRPLPSEGVEWGRRRRQEGSWRLQRSLARWPTDAGGVFAAQNPSRCLLPVPPWTVFAAIATLHSPAEGRDSPRMTWICLSCMLWVGAFCNRQDPRTPFHLLFSLRLWGAGGLCF